MKFLIVIISLIPTTILAEGITYECNHENDINDCIMYATSNFPVSAIDYEIEGNILEFNPEEPWLGDYENNKILLYTDEFQSNKFKIGNIKFKGKIKEKRLSYGDNNFKEIIIYEKSEFNYFIIIIPVIIIVIIILLIKRRIRK